MSPKQRSGQRERGDQPWLTIALALGALAWMAWADLETRTAEAQADAALATAADILLAHPYLEAPEVVVTRIGEEALETRRQVYRGEVRRNGGFGASAFEQARAQEQFGAAMSAYGAAIAARPISRFGFAPGAGALHTVVSHAVAHASWFACAANVLALVVLGGLAERSFGRAGFAALALGSLFASAGFTALAFGDRGLALAGLGGALSGMLGATAVGALRGRRAPGSALALAVGAAWFAAPYALAREWSLAGEVGGPIDLAALVSPWIHAAGLGFGVSFGLMAPQAKRRATPAARTRGSEGATQLLDQAQQALHKGDRERAFSLLSQRVHDNPGDRAAGLLLWQVGRAIGRDLDAVAAMLRVVRDELRGNMHDECVTHWLLLAQVEQSIRVEPALLVALAPLLETRGHREAALTALESALADRECGARQAAQIALAAEPLDPDLARRAAARALADASLPGDMRRELGERFRAASPPAAPRPAPSRGPNAAIDPGADEPIVDLVEPVAGSPPPAEREQWEDPQLRPDDSASGGLELHGAVSLEALQVDVTPEPSAPVEAAAPPAAPRRVPRNAGGDRRALDSAEPIRGPGAASPLQRPAKPGARPERALDVLQAIPVELTDSALRLEIIGVGKKKLRYAQVQALAAGAIGMGPNGPVLVADLVLNWRDGRDDALKIVRLRSDRFDPSALVGSGEAATAAMRRLIELLLERSGAQPLPDPRSARGSPFCEFPDFETYQLDVLMSEL
jgi:membrane associated rhomboid family serine protease